jgi:hypothetical protein
MKNDKYLVAYLRQIRANTVYAIVTAALAVSSLIWSGDTSSVWISAIATCLAFVFALLCGAHILEAFRYRRLAARERHYLDRYNHFFKF